ncbi:MAG: RNase adapter RapZ, partial [Bacilli bacterium]
MHNELIILTGMSGAGKSTAVFAFEEMKYQCIEN